jgi:1-acyl-sn-glycerol-3-phosphate acyltransferase
MSLGAWLILVLLATIPLALWIKRHLLAASRADWGRPWLNTLDGANRIFCRRFHRLHPVPVPLPAHGAALVAANHVSGLDPLLMIAASHRPLRFLIAREQYRRFGLQWLFRAVGCIPVERDGNTHRALAAARRALQRGEVVALFPQGRIYLDHETPARLKRGILHLAKLSAAPVVTLRIDGVRGAGHTLRAVALRSHARLTVFPLLYYDEAEPERLLEVLAGRIGQIR